MSLILAVNDVWKDQEKSKIGEELFIYLCLRSILDLQLTQTELYRDTIMVSSIKGKSDKLNERRVAILN